MPETPSIKKTGWARGVRLQGDLAPGESNLKEYHSLSEDEQGEDGNRSNSEDDVDYANKLGYDIKLLAVAERLSNEDSDNQSIPLSLWVQPTLIPKTHPLA